MSNEFVRTIFEPFTREQTSTVSGIQGTGLGMAITKNIIDMMGGTIQVETEPGRGTEITLALSFKRCPKQDESPETVKLEAGKRSLVVSSDDGIRSESVKILSAFCEGCEDCGSVAEAVQILRNGSHSGSYCCVLVDSSVPDCSGFSCFPQLRSIVGEQCSLFQLASAEQPEQKAQAQQAGVSAILSKPLFRSDIVNVLKQLREGGVLLDDSLRAEDFDFSGKKLLLVEDNELNSEIAVEMLSERHFEVTAVMDGQQAVEMMSTKGLHAFDLILMDIQMPVMDGYTATREIRKLASGETIPIIALSANAFEEDRQKSLAAGMNAHVAKPINFHELLVTLRRFCD